MAKKSKRKINWRKRLTKLGAPLARLGDLRPRLNRSATLALFMVGLIIVWIASGLFGGGKTPPAPAIALSEQETQSDGLRVVAQELAAEQMRNLLRFQGRTEAVRQVSLAAETPGIIEQLPVKKGNFVQKGQVICRLQTGARQAHYDEARAQLAARKIDYDAARTLFSKGHTSRVQVATTKAAYDAARAMATARKVELDRTRIRAPFDGILDDVSVFTGNYLNVGQPCASLIDKDPLLVAAYVPENMVTQVKIGTAGRALLATGEAVEGRIRYLAERPNPVTRTFLVELEVANQDLLLRDGISAELQIDAGDVRATQIPQGLLTLNDEGELGVRVIEKDSAGRVAFRKVAVLSSDADVAWVTGLGEAETVITVGHEFVKAGQNVDYTLERAAQVKTTRPAPASNPAPAPLKPASPAPLKPAPTRTATTPVPRPDIR